MAPASFDRSIGLELPDQHGRHEILAVHARGKPLDPEVDLEAIAERARRHDGRVGPDTETKAALDSPDRPGQQRLAAPRDRDLRGRQRSDDESDAVGGASGSLANDHSERHQTLNQMLVELDGFSPRAGVVVMAATNRPDASIRRS